MVEAVMLLLIVQALKLGLRCYFGQMLKNATSIPNEFFNFIEAQFLKKHLQTSLVPCIFAF